MTHISNVGTAVYHPSGMAANTIDITDRDAAKAVETTFGATQAKPSGTDNSTTSDNGAPNGGTVQTYATAKEMTEQPSTPTAESIVKALLDSPTALVDQLAREVERQDSLSGPAAHRLKALLDAMINMSQMLEKAAPAAGPDTKSPPATSTESDGMPVQAPI